MTNEKLILSCAASFAALIVGYVAYSVLLARKYVYKTKIEKLMFYPIKSLPGINVDHLEIFKDYIKYGNLFDRSFVLIDDSNRMITLRTEPKLCKIKLTLLTNDIQLEANNMPKLIIPSKVELKKSDLIHTTNIWGEDIDGQDCGVEINNWFSKYLNKPVKLIRHHIVFGYRKSKIIINNQLLKTNHANIIYQDGAQISLMNEKSVKDLNERIKKEYGDQSDEIDSGRFRMNINFETDTPYEEDKWAFIKINNIEFKFILECSRCKMTTLNQNNLEYEEEPVRTLRKYRLGPKHIFDERPKLGCYIKPIKKTGRINVGDDILVSYQN